MVRKKAPNPKSAKDLSKLMTDSAKKLLPQIRDALQMVDKGSSEADELKRWEKLFTEWFEVDESDDNLLKEGKYREVYELCISSNFK